LLDIVDYLPNLLPKTVRRAESLPSANLPVLFLVSGRALKYPMSDFAKGKNPYQAVLDTLRTASGPIALAAIKDAGPLDYQDYPLTHPIYSFLLSGQRGAINPVSDTAGIIGNFATLLLEQSGQAEPEDDNFRKPVTVPPRSPISGSLYVDSRGIQIN
jgi:hypothetical protein